MRKFGLIIYYEIKNFFHDIKFFILAPLIPVLLMITLFPIESFYKEETSSTKSFTIAVSDETGSDYSGMVISNLGNANSLKDLDLVLTDTDEAKEMIKAGEATAAIIIPEDFIESMQQGEFKPLQLLMNDKQPFQSDLIFSALESGSDMMAAVQNELYVVSKFTSDLDIPQEDKDNIFNMSMLDMIMSVLQRDAMYEISYITPWENVSLPEYYVISLLLVFIVFSSAYHMSKRNNNDRRAFYRRTVLTSVNIFSAILADTLASTLLVTLQSSVIIVFVFIIFGISWTKLASVLVLLILISWFAVIVYELAMLIFRKNRTAVLTAGLFFAVSVIFSGLIIPVSFWQAIPAFIRDYSFFYWSHNALMQIMYGMTENALMINPAIAILLFYIPFLTLIYVKRMNKVY